MTLGQGVFGFARCEPRTVTFAPSLQMPFVFSLNLHGDVGKTPWTPLAPGYSL